MGPAIAFWVLAAVSVVAALAVVLSPNIFRAGLLLALSFLAVAGLYVLLRADFLAAVQVLIYIGAVSILILLAIMLTKDVTTGGAFNRFRAQAFALVLLLVAALVYSVAATPWPISQQAPLEPTTAALGERLFGEKGFILPVEVTALLLLASALGAIVLVKERDGKWK